MRKKHKSVRKKLNTKKNNIKKKRNTKKKNNFKKRINDKKRNIQKGGGDEDEEDQGYEYDELGKEDLIEILKEKNLVIHENEKNLHTTAELGKALLFERDELEEERDILKEDNERLEELFEEAVVYVKYEKGLAEAAIKDAQDTIQGYNEKIKELNKEEEEAEAEAEAEKRRLEELNTELIKKESEISEDQSNFDDLFEKKYEGLVNQRDQLIDDLKISNKSLEDSEKALNAKRDELKAKRDELERELIKKESEIGDIKTKCEKQKKEIETECEKKIQSMELKIKEQQKCLLDISSKLNKFKLEVSSPEVSSPPEVSLLEELRENHQDL